jgi:hypothetical protein
MLDWAIVRVHLVQFDANLVERISGLPLILGQHPNGSNHAENEDTPPESIRDMHIHDSDNFTALIKTFGGLFHVCDEQQINKLVRDSKTQKGEAEYKGLEAL